MTNERLEVEGSILLYKNNCGKVGRTWHEEREVIGSRQYSAVKNNHSSNASKTMDKGREITSSVWYLAIKKIVPRQVGHCLKDERLQVEGSILL